MTSEVLPYFQRVQNDFTDWIRKRSDKLPDGVTHEKMGVYRQLLKANFHQILSQGFPLSKSILQNGDWDDLVDSFFSDHHCKTPYFSEISREFVDFIGNLSTENQVLPPFMYELAHYEWVELGLMTAPDYQCSKEDVAFVPMHDHFVHRLWLSELAWPLVYRYPVHRLNAENSMNFHNPPDLPTFILVYRDPDHEVRFIEITEMTYHLLVCLQSHPGHTLNNIIDYLLKLMGNPCSFEALFQPASDMVNDFLQRGVIQTYLPHRVNNRS